MSTQLPISAYSLRGKFHSHVTVALPEARDLERLEIFCSQRRLKLTLVELEGPAGRGQRDVMTTQYYKLDSSDALSRVLMQLEDLCSELEKDGFPVARVKLEHESLPTLEQFDQQNYREAHIKLWIPGPTADAVLAWLHEDGARRGYRPSRNPRERRFGGLVQFVNLRLYEGTPAQADVIIDSLIRDLEGQGLTILEVKRETTLLDTNHDLDRWWL